MNKDTIGVALGWSMLAIAGILACIVAVFLRGWVLIWLWTWFIIPLGMPSINFWQALGISLVAAFLTYELNISGDDPKEEAVVTLIKSISMSLMAILVGFIYQLFM